MKRHLIILFCGVVLAVVRPLQATEQMRVVRTYKIVRGKATNNRYWQRSLRTLQREFNVILKKGINAKKIEITPDLIGLQRTTRMRTNNQRKILHMQLDKIDKLLTRMNRPDRDKAIKNLQLRIYNLKQRMGGYE